MKHFVYFTTKSAAVSIYWILNITTKSSRNSWTFKDKNGKKKSYTAKCKESSRRENFNFQDYGGPSCEKRTPRWIFENKNAPAFSTATRCKNIFGKSSMYSFLEVEETVYASKRGQVGSCTIFFYDVATDQRIDNFSSLRVPLCFSLYPQRIIIWKSLKYSSSKDWLRWKVRNNFAGVRVGTKVQRELQWKDNSCCFVRSYEDDTCD